MYLRSIRGRETVAHTHVREIEEKRERERERKEKEAKWVLGRFESFVLRSRGAERVLPTRGRGTGVEL